MKKGQVAIEYLLLTGISFFVVFVLIIILSSLMESKRNEKAFYELDDFGRSIQQELILASELEDGYNRPINIPTTVNGRQYTITTGNVSPSNGYLIITLGFMGQEIFYEVPPINGSFRKGWNRIWKVNGNITIE